MKVDLPYGKKTLSVDIPTNNLLDIIYPHGIKPERTAEEYIRLALDKPMATKKLCDLAKKNDKAAIVVDDYTRPCPTWAMLPSVLKEIYRAGVNDEDITIIFATGSHREVKHEEAFHLLGGDYADRLNYISNNFKGKDFTYVGSTSKGTDVKVKNAFVEADLKILLGDVEIHYFAGYGGGRKSILPGISHYSTIQHNYKKNFFSSASKPGVLDGNPMYENMTEGARLANPSFCLNVVQNSEKEIVGAFAGDFDMVLRKGASIVDKMYKIKIREKADIVITSANGSPHDINLYQAYKAIHLSLNAVKDNGIIILAAECSDGHGSQPYYEWMKKYTKEEMEEELGKEFTIGGHKAYYHLKALERIRMFIVSDMDKDILKNVFRMEVFPSLDNALEQAFKEKGKNAKVLVIPEGTTTLIE